MGQGHEVQEKALLLESMEIGPRLHRLILEAPKLAAQSPPHPGQFLHVLAGPGYEQFLRRPLSVLDFDARNARTEIYLQVFGPGSRAIAELRPGSTVDILGSLGRAFTPAGPGRALYLVAGGVGLAPLFFWARCLARAGKAEGVALILGARSSRDLPGGGLLDALEVPVHLATDDGSAGFRGTAVSLLEHLLDRGSAPAELAACGPSPMLAAFERVAARRALRAQVCMEQIMGCAMGACQGCVVPARLTNRRSGSGEGYARVCTEGPVFEAGEVDWTAIAGRGLYAGVKA